jgi:hypothetical protein
MWYVTIHDRNDAKLRGPYQHAETASAVRRELEDRFPDKTWNLWIVWDDPDGKPPPDEEPS